MFRYGPICWSRNKQAFIALSSVEEKYQGVLNVAIQVVWLHGILTEFGIHASPSIQIFYDN